MPSRCLRAIIVAVALLLLPSVEVSAQYSEPLMSHYYELGSFYNPGSMGRTDFINIRAAGRMQWVGIDHAPVSFVGVADMPFKISQKRLATGIAVQHESYGLYRNMTLGAMIAYKLRLLGGTLTPGLRIGVLNQSFRGSEVYIPDGNEFHNPTDDAIPTTDVGGNALDLGLGLSYEIRAFSAGLSLLHANSPTVHFTTDAGFSGSRDGDGSSSSDTGVKNYEFPIGSTLYFTAAGNIPIKNTLFEVIPSIMIVSDFSDITGIATARLRYSKRFTIGAGYRYNDGLSLNLGLELKNFYVGYTYEYPFSSVSRASSGSHEIIAGYALKLDLSEKNKHKHKSIRIL